MITPLHHAIKTAIHFLVRSRRPNVVAYATLGEIEAHVSQDPSYEASKFAEYLDDVLEMNSMFYRYDDSVQLKDLRSSIEFYKLYQDPTESDYEQLRDLVILEMQRYTYQTTFAFEETVKRIKALPNMTFGDYAVERVFYRLYREGVILQNTNHAGGYILAEEYQDSTAPTARLLTGKDALNKAADFFDRLNKACSVLQNQGTGAYAEFVIEDMPMFSKHMDAKNLSYERFEIPDANLVLYRVYPKAST